MILKSLFETRKIEKVAEKQSRSLYMFIQLKIYSVKYVLAEMLSEFIGPKR